VRQDIFGVIKENQDYLRYIRLQPMWYRKLSRDPHLLEKMGTEATFHFEKSIPQRVNKLTNGVQVASIMLNMLQGMNSKG